MMRPPLAVSTAATVRVIVAQAVGVVSFVVAGAAGVGAGGSVAVAVVVGASAVVPVRTRTSTWWLSSALRNRWGRPRRDTSRVMSLPYEHGRSVGVRWDGRRLSATMEVSPAFSGTSVIERGASAPDVVVPMTRLLSALAHHDLDQVYVDVSSHGRRLGTDSHAAGAYDHLIGPLPAVAVRSTFVTVTLDTRRAADAVSRRGVGFDGATKAFAVALGRVERTLSGSGVRPRILTASEFSAVARYFSAGVGRGGGRRISGWALPARDIGAVFLEDVWTAPTAATTITVKLRPCDHPGHLRAAALYSVTDDAEIGRPPVPRSRPLRGNHVRLLRAQEPARTSTDDALAPCATVDATRLTELPLPVAGCGQLLGSDSSGRAVAARLWGPGTSTVHVRGELFLARQLVFRAIAIGATVLVSTERSVEWRQLALSLADPRSLTVFEPSEGLSLVADRGVDLVVVDSHSMRPPVPSSTTMYLRDTPDGSMPDAADITIVQPGCRGEDVVVTSRSGTEMLTLVTVGQETAFIGRPRLEAGFQRG